MDKGTQGKVRSPGPSRSDQVCLVEILRPGKGPWHLSTLWGTWEPSTSHREMGGRLLSSLRCFEWDDSLQVLSLEGAQRDSEETSTVVDERGPTYPEVLEKGSKKMSWVSFYREHFPSFDSGSATDQGFVSVKCPFHEDVRASAGASIQTGVFHCFVCGDFSPSQFLARVTGMNMSEAHQVVYSYQMEHDLVVREDTFVSRFPSRNSHLEELQRESLQWMDPDHPVVMEYCDAKGVEFQTLVDLEVGLLPAERTHWGRDSLVFPYRYGGQVVGIRYRDILSNKGGEPGCHFTLWGVDTLERKVTYPTVVLVEGETDRVVTYQSLKGLGIPVLSTPTATIKKEWVREFEGVKQVVLIPQSDEASQRMTQKAREFFPSIVVLPLNFGRGERGKDVADWLVYHDRSELLSLVQSVQELELRRVMTSEEFEEMAARPRRWMIKGLISRHQLGLIGGAPKSMKTWMVLNLMKCLLEYDSEFCLIPKLTCELRRPPRILFFEEEGDIEEFYDRVDTTLRGTRWKEFCFWGHSLGIKLDSPIWVEKIAQEVLDRRIDLLIIDPFHRTYDVDENEASEMGKVFNNIAYLLSRFRDMSIIILHHYNKSSTGRDKWSAFRGSNRIAAEADFALFLDKTKRGVELRVEGRSIIPPTDPNGNEGIKLQFKDGLFELQN